MSRQHRGYVRSGPDEADIVACGHCQMQVDVPPAGHGQSVPLDFCRVCMRFVCKACEAVRLVRGCVTWEKLIDDMEDAARRREALR